MSSWPPDPFSPPAPLVLNGRSLTVIDRAFDAFFRAQVPQTVRLARLITGSQTVGEEIAQEAFSAVYVRWGRLDEPAGYLRTAVVNRSRSYLRRLEVARRGTVRLGVPEAGHEDQYVDADGSLRAALEGLNERQRTAIVLRYWADMSEREIARALDCRPGTVKSMLSRAMDELRKVIDQ
jgi:RNA polymerase sigma-70 factor (sigma-E family)